MPAPPGMDKEYRNFWGGVIIKATLATTMAALVAGMWDDEEDKDWRKEEFLNNFKRLRWTGVNVSGIYRSLGVDVPPDERRVFSVVGHFADPLKLVHPEKLIKGKGSPLTRMASSALTKSDWRERPYNSVSVWINTGSMKKKSRYEPKENFWEALPAIAASQVVSMQPIQIGHLLRYMQGEEDGLTAIMSSAGAHMTETHEPKGGYEFTDLYKTALKTARQYKSIRESKDTKRAFEYREENRNMLNNTQRIKRVYSKINHIYKRIRTIENDITMNPVIKRRKIIALKKRAYGIADKFMIFYNRRTR